MPRVPASALALCLTVAACGDDGGSATDAGPEFDAGPCGAGLRYQVEVFDWSEDVAVLAASDGPSQVTVTEVGNDENTTTAAPNGRAILCLDEMVSQVRFESSAHRTRIEVVSAEAYRATLSAEGAISYRVYLLAQEDLDGLAAGDASTGSAHVFVDARGDNSLTPSIDRDADAPLLGAAPGAFAPGDTTTDTETVVVFRNAASGGAALSIPATCSKPDSLPTPAGTVVGALAFCVFE